MSNEEQGPPGERGPTGDLGPTGVKGNKGFAGVEGARGAQGVPGPPVLMAATSEASRKASVFKALTGLLIAGIVFIVLVTTFSERTRQNDRIDDLAAQIDATTARAAVERADLLGQIETFRADEEAERLVDDCVALYEDDIATGIALSQVALSDLFVGVVARPVLSPPDVKADNLDNQRLVALLDEANGPLRAAVKALADYRAIDPPPGVCPHPQAG